MIIGTNADDGDVMLAAQGRDAFRDGVTDDGVDAILDYVIKNYYAPADEVR